MGRRLDAVLLIAFGGPTRPEEIRPFLARVLAGRPVPPERVEEVAHHYEAIGGRSPLTELILRQARALQAALDHDGRGLPVHVGMRNWTPFLDEALAAMAAAGVRRALGIILAPHQTEASWERYQVAVAEARARLGADAPEVEYAPPWFDHPRFIEAVAARADEALTEIPPERREAAPLVFTAHSVPRAMAEASPYIAQLTASARLTAERLGRRGWSIAYQSRSGRPDEPWLEPDIGEVIRGLAHDGAREVVVVPIGFVTEHVEILYDLDIEARAIAGKAGLDFHRARAVNDHPAFIAMLADLVREAARP